MAKKGFIRKGKKHSSGRVVVATEMKNARATITNRFLRGLRK